MTYYKLTEDHRVVPAEFDDFAALTKEDRRVAQTHICDGKKWVSTVFLGLDHSFGEPGPPIVFETMVFEESGGEIDFKGIYQERYRTWEEAVAGHERVVRAMEKGKPPDEEVE